MKKLFYIILTLVLIILGCAYIKSRTETSLPSNVQPITAETATENLPSNDNCVCASECLCKEGETECDCSQTKSTCSCQQENGQIITLESVEANNEDIEELNPEETADEDETILHE